MDVVVDGLEADVDAVLFAEVVGGGLGGHAEFADVVGEVLVDDGGDFATWAVFAFAFLANGLGRAGAVAGEALRQGAAGLGGNGAPARKLIMERRRRQADSLGDPTDGVGFLQLTVFVPSALNDGAVIACQMRSGSLVYGILALFFGHISPFFNVVKTCIKARLGRLMCPFLPFALQYGRGSRRP